MALKICIKVCATAFCLYLRQAADPRGAGPCVMAAVPIPTQGGEQANTALSGAGKFPPDDSMAGDALPASWRYFLRAVGAFVALLCLWHFFTHQRRGFRSFSARASPFGSFFRNFFSTYFTLIQASLSCLREEQHKAVHRVTRFT